MMRGFRVVVMVSAAVLLVSAGVSAQRNPGTRAGGATADSLRVVATPQELMHAVVIPSSDAVFKLAGDQPKNADEWRTVRLQSLALAESANLLMMPGRGPDATTWNQMSKAMMDAALLAVKAADAKNADALDAASNSIYDTCDSCHDKYMKK